MKIVADNAIPFLDGVLEPFAEVCRRPGREISAEDGKIRVNDPNSRVRSGKLWDYSRLEHQINNLWVYTAM